jgi:hypothetical protein
LSNRSDAALWKQQDLLYATLLGGVDKYVSSLAGMTRALSHSDGILTCIDERLEKGSGCCAAGSLALLSEYKSRAYCKRANVRGLTSHRNCGAIMKLMASDKRFRNFDPANPYHVDRVAVDVAQEKALMLGIAYVTHLPVSEPTHSARTVYYVGVPNFVPHRVPGLPKGFLVSRRNHDPEDALEEVGIALGIAQKTFEKQVSTGASALLIIAVGDNSQEFSHEALARELHEIEQRHNGLVRVDGFCATQFR